MSFKKQESADTTNLLSQNKFKKLLRQLHLPSITGKISFSLSQTYLHYPIGKKRSKHFSYETTRRPFLYRDN